MASTRRAALLTSTTSITTSPDSTIGPAPPDCIPFEARSCYQPAGPFFPQELFARFAATPSGGIPDEPWAQRHMTWSPYSPARTNSAVRSGGDPQSVVATPRHDRRSRQAPSSSRRATVATEVDAVRAPRHRRGIGILRKVPIPLCGAGMRRRAADGSHSTRCPGRRC